MCNILPTHQSSQKSIFLQSDVDQAAATTAKIVIVFFQATSIFGKKNKTNKNNILFLLTMQFLCKHLMNLYNVKWFAVCLPFRVKWVTLGLPYPWPPVGQSAAPLQHTLCITEEEFCRPFAQVSASWSRRLNHSQTHSEMLPQSATDSRTPTQPLWPSGDYVDYALICVCGHRFSSISLIA